MKIRKCGEIRKDFIIDKLQRKLEIVNYELASLNVAIDIAKNNFSITEIQEQISEIRDFIEN